MRRTWIIRTLATTPLASATSRRHRAGANPDVEVVSPSAEVNMQCGQRVNLAVMWIKKKYLYSFNLDSNCNLSPTTGRNIHPGYFFKSQCRYNWNGRFQPFTGHEGPKAPFTRRFVNAIPAAEWRARYWSCSKTNGGFTRRYALDSECDSRFVNRRNFGRRATF